MDYRKILFVSVSLIVLVAGIHDLMIYFGVDSEPEYPHLQADYQMNGSWFTSAEKSDDIIHYTPENRSFVYFNEDQDEVIFVHAINLSSIQERDYRREYSVRMAISDTYLDNISDFEVYQVDSSEVPDTGYHIKMHSLPVEEIRDLGNGEEVLFRTAVSETGEDPEFFGTHATVFLLRRELVFDRSQLQTPGFNLKSQIT